jgi:hypothetical protein
VRVVALRRGLSHLDLRRLERLRVASKARQQLLVVREERAKNADAFQEIAQALRGEEDLERSGLARLVEGDGASRHGLRESLAAVSQARNLGGDLCQLRPRLRRLVTGGVRVARVLLLCLVHLLERLEKTPLLSVEGAESLAPLLDRAANLL